MNNKIFNYEFGEKIKSKPQKIYLFKDKMIKINNFQILN